MAAGYLERELAAESVYENRRLLTVFGDLVGKVKRAVHRKNNNGNSGSTATEISPASSKKRSKRSPKGGAQEDTMPTRPSTFQAGAQEDTVPTRPSTFQAGAQEDTMPTRQSTFQAGDWTFTRDDSKNKATLQNLSKKVFAEVPKESKLVWEEDRWVLKKKLGHFSKNSREEVLAELGPDIFSQENDQGFTEALLGWVWNIEQKDKGDIKNVQVRFGDSTDCFVFYPAGKVKLQLPLFVKFSFTERIGTFQNLINRATAQYQIKKILMEPEFGTTLEKYLAARKKEIEYEEEKWRQRVNAKFKH